MSNRNVIQQKCDSKKNGDLNISENRRLNGSLFICRHYFFLAGAFVAFTAFAGFAVRSFSALPGVNLPLVLAAIFNALPVCGFLPVFLARHV